MFKKIEIWILYLFILLTIPVTISFGLLIRHELLEAPRFRGISKKALFLVEIPVKVKRIIFNDDNRVPTRFPLLNGFDGKPNSKESYLLLSRYSGNLKEGIVELVDLTNFQVLHTWNPDIDKFNKSVNNQEEFRYIKRDANNSRYVLTHPKLIEDGGLVFTDNSPLRKIDFCSNLIFQKYHDKFHHSIETDIEGNIWASTYIYPQSLPIEKVGNKVMGDFGYVDDGIVKLSPNGEILFEKSLSEIFIENGLEYLLFATGDINNFLFDPTHLNDIQPVDFDGEFWKKGDLFLSLRHQSMVILYRPSTNKIIWKGTGPFFHQHDVDILNDHTISVFNNNSKDFISGDVVDGNNQVIIYDFKTDKYSLYLDDSLIKNDVRTTTEGRGQILSNGDLFVEETNFGRMLYINSDGSLRWTYVNRADDKKTYDVGWARIIYNNKDINIVKKFLSSRVKCND